jgi:hypothetical protein
MESRNMPDANAATEERLRDAFRRRDAGAARDLLQRHPEFRRRIDKPAFSFNAPAIVAFASDAAMVDVLFEVGRPKEERWRTI